MNRWDTKWATLKGNGGFNEQPHPLVVELVEKLTPGRALDVACGVGRHSIYLAERGWQVTAVDSSQVAIELLSQAAVDKHLPIDARLADLERGEFLIEPDGYDLIVNCCYLQRNLFPAIKAGVKVGGCVLAVIAMVDDDPAVKPMNPTFLLQPDELRAQFDGWEVLREAEHKPETGKRRMAELAARKVL